MLMPEEIANYMDTSSKLTKKELLAQVKSLFESLDYWQDVHIRRSETYDRLQEETNERLHVAEKALKTLTIQCKKCTYYKHFKNKAKFLVYREVEK